MSEKVFVCIGRLALMISQINSCPHSVVHHQVVRDGHMEYINLVP